MASPMSRVNSLVSADIGNYLTNKETWKDIIFNVKAYGAKGDGTTDDTVSINTLINTIDKGVIVFPPGDYLITKQGTRILGFSSAARGYGLLFLNKSNISVVMMPGAKIKMSVTAANVFNAFWLEGCDNMEIIGTTFEGTGLTTSLMLEEGTGITITASTRVTVDSPLSTNLRGCARAYNSSDITIKNGFSSIYTNEHATGHFALYSSKDSVIDHCVSYGATLDGDMFIFGGSSFNCTISNSRSHAYVYGDATKTIFKTDGQGIQIDSGGRNCKLLDNYVYGYFYGFDSKNASEGTIISRCTAEKCKVGISARKGEGSSAPTSVLEITDNTITPNGGNGNNVPILGSFTEPFAIGLFDVYGGAVIEGNTMYNSIDTQVESPAYDFMGVVIGISDNVTDTQQGGFMIENNLFQFENRLASLFGVNRKQAIYITSSFKVNNVNITGNKFDLPQTGVLANMVEAYNVYGFTFSDNEFSNLAATGPKLIKMSGGLRAKIDGNRFGTHFGVLEIYNINNVSFSDNMSSESVNTTPTPTVLVDNCLFVKVNNNIQIPDTSLNLDTFYLITQNSANWVSGQLNVLKLINKGSANWFSSTATNFLFDNNVVD